jgi:hypothetical protein
MSFFRLYVLAAILADRPPACHGRTAGATASDAAGSCAIRAAKGRV